jgi:hypothetical protein
MRLFENKSTFNPRFNNTSISIGKYATNGKMKFELLNTKYTSDSKTVFVFGSEYFVILYIGKRAEVSFD